MNEDQQSRPMKEYKATYTETRTLTKIISAEDGEHAYEIFQDVIGNSSEEHWSQGNDNIEIKETLKKDIKEK